MRGSMTYDHDVVHPSKHLLCQTSHGSRERQTDTTSTHQRSTSISLDRSSSNGSYNNKIKVSGGSSIYSNDKHCAPNIKHLLFSDVKQQQKVADQDSIASPTSSNSSMFSTSTSVDSTSSADSTVLSSTSSSHCSTSIFTDYPVGNITINMLQHTKAKLPMPTAYGGTSNFMEWARGFRAFLFINHFEYIPQLDDAQTPLHTPQLTLLNLMPSPGQHRSNHNSYY